MKEAINANIGGQIFTLDRDAYDHLIIYLNDLRRNISHDTDEVMNDIEIHLAEILREELSSRMMVVTLAMADRAIARIGKPEDFASEGNQNRQTNTNNTMNTSKLRRSRTNRSIAGVCGGLANYFEADATLLRIVMLLLILFGGMSLWVYIILWLLIPSEE
jgi:phage shock protein PspC (stress-responsive transcriptional regulator)